jgi:hypothetical protein
MTNIQLHFAPTAADAGPACASCSGPTRLVGVEPHPTKADTDLRTYQCMACQEMQASVVPATQLHA